MLCFQAFGPKNWENALKKYIFELLAYWHTLGVINNRRFLISFLVFTAKNFSTTFSAQKLSNVPMMINVFVPKSPHYAK